MSMCNWVHQRIKVKCRQIRILSLDVHHRWMVIPESKMNQTSVVQKGRQFAWFQKHVYPKGPFFVINYLLH